MHHWVQRSVRAISECLIRWRLSDLDGHGNGLSASVAIQSPSKDLTNGRLIPQWLWRSCFAVLFCVMLVGGAAADEPHDRAVGLLQEAVQYSGGNPGALLVMAEAFAKTGDSTTAGRLLLKAWDESLKKEYDEVRRLALMQIAECQAEIGQADVAIKAVKQLPSSYEHAIVLSSIASVQAGQGNAAGAFQTVDLIPAQERFQDDMPTTHRDTALLGVSMAFSERHDYADAIKALEMIGGSLSLSEEDKIAASKTKATAQVLVAQDQAKAGDLNEAFQTAHAIIGERHRDVAWRLILCAAADQMEVATAIETFNAIKHQPQKNMGATCLVASLCRRKELEEAASIVKDIEGTAERAEGLLEIAIAHAASGENEKVRALLDESMVIAPMEVDLKNTTMKRIVEALVNSGHHDQGEELAQELTEPVARSVSFQSIAIAQWKKGNKDIAQRAILESQKAANDISDPYFGSVRLREFAVVLADVNAKEESLAAMKSALAAGNMVEPAGGTDVINFTDIATSQMAVGDIEGAEATFEIAYTAARKYSDRSYSATLLAGVIEAQAHFGNSTRAIQIAQEEKSPDFRVTMLVAAANGLLAR
jgi:tetratricopeptide (TPR) repeat protein